MKSPIPAAALCLVLASSAFAQDVDPETRFHRAYEQEVVEGKTADAARVYLAMMDDQGVPARLRQESKFRFAVTATLLGRADEARAHFTELSKDAAAPESLRARAAEYLDATKSIGVGTELDKKLQSLVFDLARELPSDSSAPKPYRDFEVIGKAAVPFLRQLLQHGDRPLRQHAFRLLMRLREPGMMKLWSTDLNGPQSFASDLRAYLEAMPAERPDFESKLLALDDASLAFLAVANQAKPPLSAEFLRALAARKFPRHALLAHLANRAWRDESLRALRVEWIRTGDAELAAEATISLLKHLKVTPTQAAADAEIFPLVVERLQTMPLAWEPTNWNKLRRADSNYDEIIYGWQGFDALAQAAPPAAVLDALEASIARGAAAKADDPANPLTDGLVEALALAARAHEPRDEDLRRFASLLRKWAEPAAAWTSPSFAGALTAHARFAISGLPRPEAESMAAWAVNGPETHGPKPIRQAIPFAKASDVPIALAALRAAGPLTRKALLESFGLTDDRSRTSDVAFARAVLQAMPEMCRFLPPDSPESPVALFAAYASLLPVEEARARLADVGGAVAATPQSNARRNGLYYLLGRGRDVPADYRRDVAAPSLDALWTAFAARDPGLVTDAAMKLFQDGDESVRAATAPFLLAHADAFDGARLAVLAKNPSLFPPAQWVPRAKSVEINWEIPRGAATDDAAREMTKDPGAVTPFALAFVAQYASDEARREIFGRLLAFPSPPLELKRLFARNAGQGPPEPAEEMLQRELATPTPDLETVRHLVYFLAESLPSERLFPAVRLLLGASDSESIHAGIDAAKNLGREELLAALVAALDSLQPNVRSEAKAAIDSIVALRNLKDEARRSAGGK
jgi:hypothetical protein